MTRHQRHHEALDPWWESSPEHGSRASLTEQIAAEAARWVVDGGMEYGAAKQKAARTLARHGGSHRPDMPSNEQVEQQVREYLELFHADTQPMELRALRELALQWMEDLGEFHPHLTGAVWRGTATRLSAIHIDLYCPDSKSAEIALINRGLDIDIQTLEHPGQDPVDVLTLSSWCAELRDEITLHLAVRDLDDIRGALLPDGKGQTWRGDTQAVRQLLAKS